jgi:hypothetical protein
MYYVKELFEQFAKETVPQLQVVAGSHFGKSITYVADEKHLEIVGSPFLSVLVDGRRPTSPNAKTGSPTLQESILAWIQAKGITAKPNESGKIPTQTSLSYAIAKSIHKRGTMLYWKYGGGNNIFDRILTDDRVNNLLNQIPEFYKKDVETTMLRELQKIEKQ